MSEKDQDLVPYRGLKNHESKNRGSKNHESKNQGSKNRVRGSDVRGKPHLIVVPGTGTSLVTSGEMKAVRRGNPFLDKLGTIMEDPDFRGFFNEYFKNWGDAKSVLMIMYTYNFMDELYFEKTEKRLSSDELVYLIKKMLHNKETRRVMANAVQNMIHQEGTFHDQIEKLLIENFSELQIVDSHQIADSKID